MQFINCICVLQCMRVKVVQNNLYYNPATGKVIASYNDSG
jgi:hypothetical protein